MNREKLYEIRKQGKTVVVWVTSMSLLVYLLSSFYQGRDEDGWIMHHATVNMLMSPEWLDGESRDCVADMTPHELVLPYVVTASVAPTRLWRQKVIRYRWRSGGKWSELSRTGPTISTASGMG